MVNSLAVDPLYHPVAGPVGAADKEDDMTSWAARCLQAVLPVASVLAVAGCTSVVEGRPMGPAHDGASVTLMDTGDYPIAAGPPFGTAGSDPLTQGILEAQRIGANVFTPWEVDASLWQRPIVELSGRTGPIGDAAQLKTLDTFADPLPDVAAGHGFIAGFSTERMSESGPGPSKSLQNVVLMFPDPGAAAVAAGEMAAKLPLPPGASGRQPVPIGDQPEAVATGYATTDGGHTVQSFTAHGRYVLYQSAHTVGADRSTYAAAELVSGVLYPQEQLIDRFIPTDSAKLAELPKDPTGQLLAHTLWAPDNSSPFIIGAWPAHTWLQFEDNPIRAAAWFNAAGIDWVAQRLATLYRAGDAAKAARLVEEFADDMSAMPDVEPVKSAVPGLPSARCFVRTKGLLPMTDPINWRQIIWHYKCVAHADRYVFAVFSDHEQDAKQQISAQYRIAAGK